jgi:hypothetical protein
MTKMESDQYDLVRFAIEKIIAHLGELFTRVAALEQLVTTQTPDTTDGNPERNPTPPDA